MDDNFPIIESGKISSNFLRENNARINYDRNYLELDIHIISFTNKINNAEVILQT